jgi:uncharacterized protein (DUF2147 family)
MLKRDSLLICRSLAAWLLAAVASPIVAHAGDKPPAADAIVGDWLVESRDAGIRIAAAGTAPERHYGGHIVWLKDERYKAEDGPDLAGKPIMDLNNPDHSKRNRPLLGLPLLWDLHFEHGMWTEGRVYNSDDGHTYRCTIRLIDADHLRLHGYVGIQLLGGNTTWTRVSLPPAAASAAPATSP